MPNKKYIKMYGKQRTGTNYLSRLMSINFNAEVLVNVFGWKHGLWENPQVWAHNHRYINDNIYFYDGNEKRVEVCKYTFPELMDISKDLLFLFIVKDPYAFIYSYMRYYKRDINDKKIVIEQCLDYNLKYCDYLEKVNGDLDGVLIRYEDILCDLSGVMGGLSKHKSLEYNGKEFKDIEKAVNSGGKEKNNLQDKDFYVNRLFLRKTPLDIIRLISDTIDWGIFNNMGYYKDK